MENTIEIRVIGKSATGKTTICREIVDALREHGFNVEWDVTPDFTSENLLRKKVQNHEFRLGVVYGKGTKILVKEVPAIERMVFTGTTE